jgi:hypothetical protein
MQPLNPDYPYLDFQLTAAKASAEIWLRVARERGKEDHPLAKIAKENIAFIERKRNERAT